MEYLSIAPLLKLPMGKLNIYTYSTGEIIQDFKIGQLVEMSMHKKLQKGVIINVHRKNPLKDMDVKILPINKLLYPEPLINKSQFKLIDAASDHYLSPIGVFLRLIVPDIPKKNIFPAESPICTGSKLKIINSEQSLCLLRAFHDQRLKHYLDEIRLALKNGRQTLILVPSINSILKFQDILHNEFGDIRLAIFHGQAAKSKYFCDYLASYSGEADIILGTRQAIFSPMKNPGLIIVEEENNSSFKQWDMSPRYDSRYLALTRSKIEHTKLIFGSSSPTFTTYHFFQQKNLKINDKISPFESPDDLVMIDMKDELKSGNYSMFSEKLKNRLSQTVKNKQQALIFINRRASSSFVMCRDCGHIIKCGRCDSALVEYGTGMLRCLHCTANHPLPSICPACSSSKIKSFGVGAEKVWSEAKKLFPGSNNQLYDQDIARRKKILKGIFQKFDTGQIDILIGTQPILSWQPFNLGLIAFLDIDSLLSFPDFRSFEKTFSLVSESISSQNKYKILVQTYNPESQFFYFLKFQQYEKLYATEMDLRKSMGYPPYSKAIKLIAKNKNENLAKDQVEKVKTMLEKTFSSDLNIKLLGPSKPLVAKIRDYYIYHLLILIPNDLSADIKNGITEMLKNLAPDILIDVDPDNLN